MTAIYRSIPRRPDHTNAVRAGPGNDRILAKPGNGPLKGDAGNDEVYGGIGDDFVGRRRRQQLLDGAMART